MHKRGVHDVGGLPAGPISREEHAEEEWELRMNSMITVLRSPGVRLMNIDEIRRNVESLGHEAHVNLTYSERALFAATSTLIQRGIITISELGGMMAKLAEAEGRRNDTDAR